MNSKELHHIFLSSNGICTDTRKLKKGQLFFALKGDNFNGNKYALKAIENGANYAIIDDESISHEKCILVNDALESLQKLAKHHRAALKLPIISLTGSNGKTTSKELIDVVLKTKYKTVATVGNLNNHIGVPLTLLKMNNSTEMGIVEMGANHLKEIELLSSISSPDYGYITNIGKAHLEGFGSEENILKGKTELFKYLEKNNGTVFINKEDKKLVNSAEKLSRIEFSNTINSDYKIELVSANPFVKIRYKNTTINSNLIGEYNYTNIAASITIGLHFKIDIENIKKAIENYIPKINRSQLIQKENNELILDAYNANPSSMKAALVNFEKTTTNKTKIVILGDMFELGSYSKEEHQKIIELLNNSNSIKKAYLAGGHFSESTIKNNKIFIFKDTEDLLNELKTANIQDAYILIKGSRGMTLERTTEFL